MTIKTKSGFECKVNEKKAADWRFVKYLAMCDSKDESDMLKGITSAVPFLLGKDGEDALIKHLEDEDGIVSSEAMMTEFKEIMTAIGDKAKNS